MPDFTKYSNYDEKTSFSGVTFGANSPVLEVEQNELQQIQDTKFKRLTEILGSCVHPLSDGSVAFNSGTNKLTLTNCVAIADGFSAFINSAEVTMSGTNKVAYVKLEEITVKGNNTLKEYGITTGGNVSNPIYDTRVGAETTRRRLIAVTLMAGASLPSDTSTIKYAPVGEIADGEFIPEFVVDSYADLGFSVNSEGELCVVYDDEE